MARRRIEEEHENHERWLEFSRGGTFHHRARNGVAH